MPISLSCLEILIVYQLVLNNVNIDKDYLSFHSKNTYIFSFKDEITNFGNPRQTDEKIN